MYEQASPRVSIWHQPQFKWLLIAGVAILLLVIALWSLTKRSQASTGLTSALDPNIPNGLSADALNNPIVVVLPPTVNPPAGVPGPLPIPAPIAPSGSPIDPTMPPPPIPPSPLPPQPFGGTLTGPTGILTRP